VIWRVFARPVAGYCRRRFSKFSKFLHKNGALPMASWVPTLCLVFSTAVPPVDTKFVQVGPASSLGQSSAIARSPGQKRAVILIEGLELHPLDHRNGFRADLRPWQEPASLLVRTLSREADVFAFIYGQTAAVSDIAAMPVLSEGVQRLRQSGYTEVVLVGFSAGGLIARQLVEDNPEVGVTRVIQVCAPNLGSSLAKIKSSVGPAQESFLQSLTQRARSRTLQERRNKLIPPDVEFVCVVGNGLVVGDGVVSTRSQWSEDLQAQGVPAVVLSTEHWEALRDDRSAQTVARLVRESQPRWDAARVAAMRKRLWPARSWVR
jgi:pimeloyl-ACP methyl ester carboxylesterase